MQKIICMLVLLVTSFVVVAGQTRQFTRDSIEYVLELPSPAWQDISRLDVHDHLEFVNGDNRTNGYLRVRKIFVDRPTTAAELFSDQQKWELQRLTGFVVCGECEGISFEGRLKGAVFSYEYVIAGRTMYGRIYYLQLDQHTFYSLHFTVARDKLPTVRDQMEHIAKSFHLKASS